MRITLKESMLSFKKLMEIVTKVHIFKVQKRVQKRRVNIIFNREF